MGSALRSRIRARPTAIAATALLLSAGCASGSATATGTGTGTASGPSVIAVTGVVLAEPGCGGPVQLDSPCPPRPMAGAQVQALQATRVVATATTGADGRYALRLPPGVYRLVATAAGALHTTTTAQITVASSPVSENLVVDSGMR